MRYPENDLSGVQEDLFTLEEKRRYHSFRSVKRKSEFYHTRVLWKYFEHDQSICYDAFGRPFLESGFISISHSHDLIVIAYDADHPVGVDVEYYSPKIREVLHKFISSADEKLLCVESDRDLTIAWSIKEAVYKMERINGLSFKEHIHVSIDDTEARVTVLKGAEKHHYRFNYIDRGNYVITFCSYGNLK